MRAGLALAPVVALLPLLVRSANGAPEAERAKSVLTYDEPLKYLFTYDHWRRSGPVAERTYWFSATVLLKKVAATETGNDMVECRVENIEVCEAVRKLGADTSSLEFKVGVDRNGKVRRIVFPDAGKLAPQRDTFRAALVCGITQTCFLEFDGVPDLPGCMWNVQLPSRETVSGPNRALFGRGNGRKLVYHLADETTVPGVQGKAKVVVGRETGEVTSGLSVVAYIDTGKRRIVRARWVARLPDRETGTVMRANVFTAQLAMETPAENGH